MRNLGIYRKGLLNQQLSVCRLPRIGVRLHYMADEGLMEKVKSLHNEKARFLIDCKISNREMWKGNHRAKDNPRIFALMAK